MELRRILYLSVWQNQSGSPGFNWDGNTQGRETILYCLYTLVVQLEEQIRPKDNVGGSIPLKCTMNIICPHRSVEGQGSSKALTEVRILLGVQIC